MPIISYKKKDSIRGDTGAEGDNWYVRNATSEECPSGGYTFVNQNDEIQKLCKPPIPTSLVYQITSTQDADRGTTINTFKLPIKSKSDIRMNFYINRDPLPFPKTLLIFIDDVQFAKQTYDINNNLTNLNLEWDVRTQNIISNQRYKTNNSGFIKFKFVYADKNTTILKFYPSFVYINYA